MFHKDRFIEACAAAVGEGQKAIREVVLEAVADPAGVIAELGEPDKAGVYPLHKSDNLTVINFVWAPYMTLLPHNHNMFAVIGLYGGREDNMFWRRLARDRVPELEAAGRAIHGAGTGCRDGAGHRSFGREPYRQTDQRHSCLWRRFLPSPQTAHPVGP